MDGCSRAVNVISIPKSSYPPSLIERSEFTLAGSYQLVIRARFIGERLRILRCFLIFPIVQKSQKKYVSSYQLLGCVGCNSLKLNLLKQALTSSYHAKQEVTATNKSTTVERSVSVPQQQNKLSSCSRICGAVGGLKQGSTSTTLVTKAS